MAKTRIKISHPNPLGVVYGCLQRYCVGACCGYEAYDLNAWWLLNGVELDGHDWLWTVLDQLDTVFETVATQKGREITDGELWWTRKADCREFYGRVQMEMLRALVHSEGLAVFNPEWLRFNDRTVELLVRAIRKKRTFGDTVILADALEEAGCPTAGILSRCRSAQPTAKAHWVVELLFSGAGGAFDRPIHPTPDRPR